MNKRVETAVLFECRTEYLMDLFEKSVFPWDMLPKIKDHIVSILVKGIDGFEKYSDNVLIGENVIISEHATIQGPAIIGSGTEIRPGAYIRGNVITGSKCVIGNSTEVKNSILLDHVQIPHYNYVGDSILGNCSHMGAGSICSNLKADRNEVIIHGDIEYKTGLRKIGGILGDGADVGCGCVLNPGTVIGRGTSAYPLTSLRGVYPENCIVKASDVVVKRR